MLITGFAAGMFATNCYIVADGPGGDAVVIDPGQDAAPQVDAVLAEHSLNPVAVLLTHGHLDHTWNAADVCDKYSIPAYIHPDDREMLADPRIGLGHALGPLIADIEFREPEKVIDFVDGDDVEVAGLRFSVDLAPGHTRGSVLLGVDVPSEDGTDPAAARVCFSGDVLFAGSIGRTDLPGGSHQQLLESIAAKLLPLSDDVVVLPGHGPQTSIGAERATNPFLQDLGERRGGESTDTTDIPRKGRNGL
ncbi:MBL fold metallo-hydrolase [Gordonia sp. TBRC 11910]|uniref:MBL fold metallo-hydrolase n=1 Tax=Gordonia asplenii TaxID=2725283 RepID=A0A848L3F7_9ACTN|nr:MBL fold metallo-hydrolase [Gordonia asplenii]NMO05057.1 MBL fold metallo-hydrolase [Gordonia asplenii]